jgi:hypothetical protein
MTLREVMGSTNDARDVQVFCAVDVRRNISVTFSGENHASEARIRFDTAGMYRQLGDVKALLRCTKQLRGNTTTGVPAPAHGTLRTTLSLEGRLNHFATVASTRSPVHRTVEELSFAFLVLLNQPLARTEAANRFEQLWNETNEAASASLGTDYAVSYIALLKDMDKKWRRLRVLN